MAHGLPSGSRGLAETCRGGTLASGDAAAECKCAKWRRGNGATIAGVATVAFGDFEWDADKAVANAAKHGVSFEEAVTVFLDLDYLLVRDALEPERLVAIGMSSQARVLFVVHCERGEKLRVISARRATRREREAYERRQESD